MELKTIIDLFRDAEALDQAKDIREISDILASQFKRCGLSSYLVTCLPEDRQARWQEQILANGWPQDWYRHYVASGYYRHDPCVALCRRTGATFLWSEVCGKNLEASASRIMDEAFEFGLREGICVPSHAPLSPPLVVTASGERGDLEPASLRIISLLSSHALLALRRLQSHGEHTSETTLTKREREILRWVAGGKTAWEISRILGLSEHTVLAHLRKAKRKLDAANNVHAVVQALLRREIEP